MKRVVCFTESLAGGGAEHQIAILSTMLAEKGFDVTVTTYTVDDDHYSIPSSIRRVRINSGKNAIDCFLHIFLYFIKLKADCVICYRQRCSVKALIPLLFRSKIRVICGERNATLTKPSFHERILFHFLYNRADYIVSNSDTQTNHISIERHSLLPKLRTIHNYTDLDHYKISLIPKDTSLIKIAVFSRFSPQKNPILFVRAMAELKRMTPQRFQVHWYGNQYSTNGLYCDDYEKVNCVIEEEKVGDVFYTHPAIKDTAVVMNAFHALCLPSLYEGFSNSIAEGICSGKPMLVSNVSDNVLMVQDERNGFLFDPNSIESICGAFIRFFSLSYNEMIQMANESRCIAEHLFNKDLFLNQYLELIDP